MAAQHLKTSDDRNGEGDVLTKWLSWCRLCAKRELSEQESTSIFDKNDAGKLSSELATSIGKYFWVNIKADDEISQCLCLECRKLIEELVAFTERVNKVQTLFCLLQNIKPKTIEQADNLRSQCGLLDEGWEHIIKPPKALVIDQQIQTDTINENNDMETCTETEDIIDVVEKPENLELESQMEAEVDNVYEYVVQDDTNVDFFGNNGYVVSLNNEDNNKSSETVETEDENVQDSDLYKELKFKINDSEEDDEQAKFHKTISEDEVELDYQETTQTLQDDEDEEDDEDAEHCIEVLEEEEDVQDSTNMNESQDERSAEIGLQKRKRGRPFGTKNSQADYSPYSFECKECERTYKNPNIFRRHMRSLHNVIVDDLPEFKSKANSCSICNKQFLTRSSLSLHMRHHLPDEEKYNVPCPYCDRKFSQVGAMRQHVNGIHHQMKPFICDQCGRACKTMASLTEHQLVHTNECPFECDVCHKRFKNKPRLKSHKDTHNESAYKCQDCGLQLNTKRTLLQHRLVHSDEKRFKCQFCEAAFKRSKALKNHLILHSGLRPYKCNFCNKSFSNGSNCRAHKKRTHPVELAEEEERGIEPERVPMPRLEELKAGMGTLIQPRKIKRNPGGLSNQLRKLLHSSEKRKEENSNDCENVAEICELSSDFHYEICKSEIDESESLVDNTAEECEETVIYEIIDEI